jgi:5'-nucleotidase
VDPFTNSGNNNADFFTATPTPKASGGSVEEPPVGGEFTIAEIQGTGDASPKAGATVTTKGVVTAAYPTGGFNGYVIQTPNTGGDLDLATHTASDAIYIYSPATVATVSVGDYVEVTGEVSEFSGLTEITVAAGGTKKLADPVAAPKPVTNQWPATDAQRE